MKETKEHLSVERLVNSIPNYVFRDVFVRRLGRTLAFSKLRGDGMSRMTESEWQQVSDYYRQLGIVGLTRVQMHEASYLLTARAVTKRF